MPPEQACQAGSAFGVELAGGSDMQVAVMAYDTPVVFLQVAKRDADNYELAMIYRINYPDVLFQFNGNTCQAVVDNSDSPLIALAKTRALFKYIRDENIEPIGSRQFLIYFKVVHDFQIPLLRQIDRTLRTLNSRQAYDAATYLDRYIVAMIARYTGKPFWIVQQSDDLRNEVTHLRNTAIESGEVEGIARFVDWDICIHNYIELNFKAPSYRSRVVRNMGN